MPKKERRAEAAKLKQASTVNIRDFLNPALFLNFQYLMPDIQILVLEHIKHVYESKQQIMDEVVFLFPVSVSFVFPAHQYFACERVLD